MSRTLSSQALRAVYAEETGEYPILLLTITATSIVEPVLISSDATQRVYEDAEQILYGTVSRGMTFFFVPFQIVLPSDTEDSAPQCSITIDNVSRQLMTVIRTLTQPPTVSMELVMSGSRDVVEAVFPGFAISSITYDAMTITGDLRVDAMVTEPFPAGTFTPSQFPGMF